MSTSLARPAVAAAFAALSALSTVQAAGLDGSVDAIFRPTGRGYGEIDEEATAAQRIRQAQFGADRLAQIRPAATGTGINYHGGPLMVANSTNVYVLYYGAWTANQRTIVNSFFSTIGGTPVYNTNHSYYNASGVRVVNSVTPLRTHDDTGYSMGKTLSDANIRTLVSNAITAGWFPRDANGVYFVLTAPDVKESSGFGSQYCGWHTYATMGGVPIKYSFVGNASVIAPTGCGVVNPSPNGDPGVDAMASVIFHELSETVTDPQLNAWYDSSGNENADKCAWNFGTLSTVPGGTAKYNVSFGGRYWKLQRNWINSGTGGCALSF